jgi:Cu/Zn superoxide dismutase
MHKLAFLPKWIPAVVIGTALLALTAFSSSQASAAAPATSAMASATLQHTPIGGQDLTWNAATKQLNVNIRLMGLAPNSTHPAHIHVGSCLGSILYTLPNVVADASGKGVSTTTINNVMGGIPTNTWYIDVHNGPTLSPQSQFLPIACASVANTSTSGKTVRSARNMLNGAPAANGSAAGNAQLMLNNGALTVKVTATGLAPNTTHAVLIHKGSCLNQGPIAYTLQPMKADAAGNGMSITMIPNISSIPAQGWYAQIHRTTDLSNQTDADPVACGNIVGP